MTLETEHPLLDLLLPHLIRYKHSWWRAICNIINTSPFKWLNNVPHLAESNEMRHKGYDLITIRPARWTVPVTKFPSRHFCVATVLELSKLVHVSMTWQNDDDKVKWLSNKSNWRNCKRSVQAVWAFIIHVWFRGNVCISPSRGQINININIPPPALTFI